MTEAAYHKVVGFFSHDITVDQVIENVLSSTLAGPQMEVLTEKSTMRAEDAAVDVASQRQEDLRGSCIIVTVRMIDYQQEVQSALLRSGAFKVVIQPMKQVNIFSRHEVTDVDETIAVKNDDHGPYIPFMPLGTDR